MTCYVNNEACNSYNHTMPSGSFCNIPVLEVNINTSSAKLLHYTCWSHRSILGIMEYIDNVVVEIINHDLDSPGHLADKTRIVGSCVRIARQILKPYYATYYESMTLQEYMSKLGF